MSVYFIRSADLIKIGYSNDVRKRVQAVISMLREGGEYLGYMAGDRRVERHFHDLFRADREYGKWFKVTERLEATVRSVAQHGYPTDEKIVSHERLQAQEERYADEAAYFIRCFFGGVVPEPGLYDKLAAVTGIASTRLQAIYAGQVSPITAGEYVVLRAIEDAARETEAALAKDFRAVPRVDRGDDE